MSKNSGFSLLTHVSRDFTRNEASCNCGCGKMTIIWPLVTKMQALRDILGFPLMVTSWNRCPSRNKKEGGSPMSQHLLSLAVDISIRNLTSKQKHSLISESVKIGFTGLGIGKEFTHLDIREGAPSTWTY